MARRIQRRTPDFPVDLSGLIPETEAPQVDFSQFHGQRIALSLPVAGQRRLFRGVAVFQHDSLLGNVLRVTLDSSEDSGNAQILLCESRWKGRIIPDIQYGCECLFLVDSLSS